MNIHQDFRYFYEDGKYWVEEYTEYVAHPNLWLTVHPSFDTEQEAIDFIKHQREVRQSYKRTYKYVE